MGTMGYDELAMRIIAVTTLHRFIDSLAGTKDHGVVKSQLEAWYAEAKVAVWSTPAAIKEKYRNASIIGNNRVVFNIKGNSYRLIVAFDYPRQWAFIKWFGTHETYDRIDAETVEYGD